MLDSYTKYRFQAKETKNIKKQWNGYIAALQEQRYDKKRLINAKKESNKLKDLAYLKGQVPMRPFSTVNKVCSSLELTLGGNDKIVWKLSMQGLYQSH